MEDPNHPMDVRWEPTERYFDDDVKKRLSKEVLPEEKAKKNRIYFRRTEFSEPSDIVSVDVKPELHAGKIATGKFTQIKEAGPNVLLQTDEPNGKVMAVVWDAERAVDVPGLIDGYRGTCLNFKTKADVIHPIYLVYKALVDYNVHTDLVLADLRGGEPLVVTDKTESLVSLGEYAYFDASGQMHVSNELQDLDAYRKLAMPEAPPTVPGMSGGADAMMDAMMMGAEGGEDPRANRKKKGKN
jgi:hypothetical protein